MIKKWANTSSRFSLRREEKTFFEIDILMIPLQVDENDVLTLLIYICSYMYNLLEHFSGSEWMNHWLNKFLSLQTSGMKIDSKKEDYKDSLPNHLVGIQIVERVETSIIDSIVFFVP